MVPAEHSTKPLAAIFAYHALAASGIADVHAASCGARVGVILVSGEPVLGNCNFWVYGELTPLVYSYQVPFSSLICCAKAEGAKKNPSSNIIKAACLRLSASMNAVRMKKPGCLIFQFSL
ncbi:MAG TPA: hypothetical protein VF427_01700 [Noviherbaspirillum sp.]